MEFDDKKKDDIDLFTIGVILAGLAFLYLIFKNGQKQVQSQQTIQPQSQQYLQESYQPMSRYENAESWEVVRSEDGFITNVRALRDATVGNGTYNSKSEQQKQPPQLSLSDTDVDKYIDGRVKQMLQKNAEEMNKYNSRFNRFAMLSDRDRMNRFGLM